MIGIYFDFKFGRFVIYLTSCGSGLSGEVLTEQGHYWVGFDISKSMLGKNFESLRYLTYLV